MSAVQEGMIANFTAISAVIFTLISLANCIRFSHRSDIDTPDVTNTKE